MYKVLVYFILSFNIILASSQINLSNEHNQDVLAQGIKNIVSKINTYTKELNKLDLLINKTDTIIKKNKHTLIEVKQKIKTLEDELVELISEKEEIQTEVLKLTTKKYYMSMAIQHTNKKSTKSVLDKEVYTIIFNSIKKELLDLDNRLKIIDNEIAKNIEQSGRLKEFISKQNKILEKNRVLKEKRNKSVTLLREQHKLYVEHFLKLATNNTLYSGNKTIPPLRSYKILKRFGTKSGLKTNNALYLKTNIKHSKARAIFDGTVAFVRNNIQGFGNMVMLRHKDNLYTIYSNLTTIPKSIKIGKKILRGYKIGTVDDILILKVTKENKYIDPKSFF
jgi:septal ring factor EnvC (AmiA/AmiB activator)